VILATAHLALSTDDWAQAAAIGLALILVVSAVLLAWAGERNPDAVVGAYAAFGGLAAFASLVSVLGLLAERAAGTPLTSRATVGLSIGILSGVLAVLALTMPVRRRVALVLTSLRPESPVHAIVVGLYLLVFLQQVGGQVAVDQVQVLTQQAHSPSLPFILGTNQLPMVIVAFAGVGIFVSRPLPAALQRLGLHIPSPRWLLFSLGVLLLLLGLGFGFDALSGLVAPQQTKAIQKVSDLLLHNVSTVPTILALGLGAGIGEEILFRGALLPRIGNVPSALLFASLHTQYALSIPTFEILILGLVLGWLRRRAGTTECVLVHSSYDVVVGLLQLLR
jgi:membrane protease YdiL (CAAX protease family)